MGVYASASLSAVKRSKDTELWEICHQCAGKVPKGWNRVSEIMTTFLEQNQIIYARFDSFVCHMSFNYGQIHMPGLCIYKFMREELELFE